MEMVVCDRCGMSSFTTRLCERCAFRYGGADPQCDICHGTAEAGAAEPHVCPEPYPYDTARMITNAALAGSGIVVSQRTKARVKLGLELGPL